MSASGTCHGIQICGVSIKLHEPLADCLNSLLESTVTSLVFEPSSDRNHFRHFETDKVTVFDGFSGV
jgi:hypothetical protein